MVNSPRVRRTEDHFVRHVDWRQKVPNFVMRKLVYVNELTLSRKSDLQLTAGCGVQELPPSLPGGEVSTNKRVYAPPWNFYVKKVALTNLFNSLAMKPCSKNWFLTCFITNGNPKQHPAIQFRVKFQKIN